MSFDSEHMLTAKIIMASGVFAGGGNTLTLTGLRMTAMVTNTGGVATETMSLSIYGMTLDQMNQASLVGSQYTASLDNKVTLSADGKTVFSGSVTTAFVDAHAMPEVAFHIEATPPAYADVTPHPPTSVKGTGDVATMMKPLVQAAGFTLENAGVNVKLSNPYLSGSIGAQMRALARHAGISLLFHNGNATIVPPGGARQGNPSVLSPETGLVGYPAFNQMQVIATSIFNPDIEPNKDITIKSSLTAACGTFRVYSVVHELECLVPRGKWFTVITAFNASPGGGGSGGDGSTNQEAPTDQ
jgi:hypothetical protein